MTALTGPLLLPADVLLVPVSELPEGARRRLSWQAGDVAITRPRLRTPSRLIDAGAAELLRQFASPSTVVEAVIRHSRARGADPEAILEGAYPLLARLVREGFLVSAADAGAGLIEASWAEGERVAGCTVLCCLQVLEDSEVYQVRAGAARAVAALKIERPAVGPVVDRRPGAARRGIAARLEREAAILAHLARGGRQEDSCAPLLLGAGMWGERRFLLLEWCGGVDAQAAAAEARERGGKEGRAELLALCRSVAEVYARLHRQAVLHGDVHPRNMLVAAGGSVRLIDFGLASWRGAPAGLAPLLRGGVAFYFDPEYAAAVLAGRTPPPASAASEQYAVAAVLYLLAAGAHYLDFSLERETMLRQIAASPPLPFAARGVPAWQELEEVLGRALAKSPGDRFPSLDTLAAALAAIPQERGTAATAASAPKPPMAPAGTSPLPMPLPSLTAALRRSSPSAELLAAMLRRLQPGGPIWEQGLPEPPFASVQFGAAGIALALYRIALAREDAELLSQADLWSARASALATQASLSSEGHDPAFYNPRLDITPATVGRASLLHGAPGVHCVEALIANARDDQSGAARAVAAFVAAARRHCPNPDLALGRSGLILGCALLLDALGGDEPLALGEKLLAGLWKEIEPLPPIAECLELPNLGMAHGWAGYLYSTLRWCQVAGQSVPDGVVDRMEQLAATAESWGRGTRWRWHGQPLAESHRRSAATTARWMAGWCNGSAGMVHLWTLASRLHELGAIASPRGSAGIAGGWWQLAAAAGWHAWEAGDSSESLCCGLAGRAYSLLELSQRGASPPWLDRARRLAERAALAAGVAEPAVSAVQAAESAPTVPAEAGMSDAAFPHSLYRGHLGIAVLAADLERPEAAAMPLFGDERWSAR